MRDNKTALMEKTAEILAAKGLTLTEAEIAALFEKPSDPKLGDLALPCFKLAKTLRQAPPKIAAELAGFIAKYDKLDAATLTAFVG